MRGGWWLFLLGLASLAFWLAAAWFIWVQMAQ